MMEVAISAFLENSHGREQTEMVEREDEALIRLQAASRLAT